MGEKRKKCAAVLLRIPGKKAIKLELFPAEEWAGEPGAAPGVYRLRQDLAWVCLDGEKYSFLAREAVAAHVAGLLFGAEAQEEAPRMIRKGTRVRLYLRKQTQVPDEGPGLGSEIVLGACALATTEMTFTTSPMFQGLDGRWRVCVAPYEEPVLAGQVEEL